MMILDIALVIGIIALLALTSYFKHQNKILAKKIILIQLQSGPMRAYDLGWGDMPIAAKYILLGNMVEEGLLVEEEGRTRVINGKEYGQKQYRLSDAGRIRSDEILRTG